MPIDHAEPCRLFANSEDPDAFRNPACEHLRSTILRGGRLTKWKGIAASIAPMVAGVAAPALIAGAISIGGAGSAWAANECGPEGAGADTITCNAGDLLP